MEIYIEILGYIGMLFTVIAFIFKNILTLRILNGIGNIFSTIYGIITKTYPTAFLNGILLIINIVMIISFFVNKNNKILIKEKID